MLKHEFKIAIRTFTPNMKHNSVKERKVGAQRNRGVMSAAEYPIERKRTLSISKHLLSKLFTKYRK